MYSFQHNSNEFQSALSGSTAQPSVHPQENEVLLGFPVEGIKAGEEVFDKYTKEDIVTACEGTLVDNREYYAEAHLLRATAYILENEEHGRSLLVLSDHPSMLHNPLVDADKSLAFMTPLKANITR